MEKLEGVKQKRKATLPALTALCVQVFCSRFQLLPFSS